MTPQDRLADAVRQCTDEIVWQVALTLQAMAKANVTNHGFRPESIEAFQRLKDATETVLAGN